MADVKWIKIATDIFDDEKILLIESLPEADSIIVVWFKLLCLAGKINNSGVFMLNDKLPYTDKMLATIFRRKETTVKMALETFEQFGMIEIIDDTITIPNWGKHQSLDKLEKRNEYMRNYMNDYRQKQKQITCKVNSKVNSKTNVNSLEEDKEIDIDKNRVEEYEMPDVDLETLWKKTRDVYPNKRNFTEGKLAWLDKFKGISTNKYGEIAYLIFKAIKLYKANYIKENGEDDNFKYVPNIKRWMNEECDYWIEQAEKEQREKENKEE